MANYPSTQNTDDNLYVGVNNLSTVLTDNPLTAGATTVNVSSTTGFPTVGILTIDLEAIHYTGTTATSFTGCTRGFDGTTGASHPVSTTVFHDIPAAHHNVLKDEIKAVSDDLRDAFTADLDDTVSPAATATDLKERLDQIVTQLKLVTGDGDWKPAPTTSIASLSANKVDLAGDTMTGILSMSANKIQGIANATSGNDVPGFNQVKILQAVTATTTTSSSTSSTSFQSSNLAATITLQATSSQVIALVMSAGDITTADEGIDCTIQRASTDLGAANGLARVRNPPGTQLQGFPIYMSILDSPATAGAVTYTARFKSVNGNPVSFHQSSAYLSTIILLEVNGLV